ncbi:MAG: hypothetical protein JJU00_20065, partial [Opitutales bacterium]|nr:hypothetical protein [Opitutales bacterium]
MGDGNTTPADAVTASEPFFIPARERRQTYDANPATAGQADHLTSDGIFTYEWDADGARPRGDGTTLSCPKDESGRVPSGRTLSQDRLVTIEHTTSQPKFRKKFRYDYMSRRVEERYYLKDANDNWEVDPDEARKRGDGAPEACPKGRAGRVPFGRTKRQYARRYIYDGYTMVAELDVSDGATGQEITTRRTFAWGHETAGGGIGALLLVEDHPNDRAYYPGYDGRGSVTLLVDADTGEKVAGMDVARQRGDGQASLARRAKATGCPLGGGLRQYDVWGKLVRATGEWRATP